MQKRRSSPRTRTDLAVSETGWTHSQYIAGFEQGIDTPGVVLVKVHATRIHYWDGEDEGEVPL